MSLSDISTTISLDLYDHDITPSKIKAIALDSKTRYVNAQLTRGGQQYDIGQSTTVTLTIIRPDKTGVQVTGATYSYLAYIDGTETTLYGARAELTQTALAVSGTLLAQFMFTSGEQILRSEIFTINNGVALDSTVSEWAGEYQGYNLDELVQNVNESSAKVDAMEQDVSELKSGFSDLDAFTRGGLDEDDEFNTVDGYTIDFNNGYLKSGDRIAVIDFLPIADADYIEVVCTDSSHTSKYDQGYKIYEYSQDTESSYLGAHKSGDNWYWTDDNALITPEKLQYNGSYIRLVFYSKLSVTIKAHYAGRRLTGLSSEVDGLSSEVDGLSSEVDALKSDFGNQIPDIEIGSIDGTTGQDATGPRRARTVGYIEIKDFWYCDPRGTDYSVIIFIYDEDKNYIKRLTSGFLGGRVTDYEILKNYTNAVYVRVAFAKSGSANMTNDDLVNLRQLIRVYRPEDGTIVRGSEVMQTNVNESIAQIDGDWFGTGYVGVEVGSLNSSTGENTDNAKRCRTSGYIAIDDFVSCNLIGTEYLAMYFLYEADKTFMLYVPFDFDTFDLTRFGIVRNYPNAKYVRFAIKRTDGGAITESDLAFLRTRIFVKIGVRRVDVDRARFDGQFNYVAYSKLSTNDAPINTEEHFINCANSGKFTALKGDVRNTADGGLIMCHDAGYTFDSNGKITSYSKTNNTPIDTLTVAQCKALTFATQWNGKDCHPCDFETFVRVCKKHGLIAYVTVRDEHIADVVAPEVLRILTLYRMTDHAIINSFTGSTLEIFRGLHSTITLSQVMNHWYIPTNDDVDYVYSLGNCIINLFNVPVQDSVPGTNVEDKLENLLSTSKYVAMLEYARSKNVVVYDAQCGNAAPDVLLKHGIVGAHMTVVPDYDWKRT